MDARGDREKRREGEKPKFAWSADPSSGRLAMPEGDSPCVTFFSFLPLQQRRSTSYTRFSDRKDADYDGCIEKVENAS
jgi:hypothetical protein